MIKLRDLIKESSQSTYEYGCVMLYFDFPKMKKIHSLINPNDIYTEEGDSTYGLEDEPHTTLLYGLHGGVSDDDVNEILDNYTFSKLKIHNPSLFQNEKYDVLKYEVGYPTDGDDFLHSCHADLKKLPHTTSYPNYNPHLTISYIKPGNGMIYVNRLNDIGLNEFILKPHYAIYSKPNGSKTKIKLNLD